MLYFEYLQYLILSVVASLMVLPLVNKRWPAHQRLTFVIGATAFLVATDWGLYLTTGDRLAETVVKWTGCKINPNFKVCGVEAEKVAAAAAAPITAPVPPPTPPASRPPQPPEPPPVIPTPSPKTAVTAQPVPLPNRSATPTSSQGPIPEDILGVRTGVPCRTALSLIAREYPDLKEPLRTGGTRYNFDIGGERVEVLAETLEVRDSKSKTALTCMPVGNQSTVIFVGRTLSFEKDGRNLVDVEANLTEKYGVLPHRMDVAAVNPFNMVRIGRVYGPNGLLPAGSKACGDFQATGGWTPLGMFGGANLQPLRLSTCIGGLFTLSLRNSSGRVTSTNIEVWDFRLAGRAAEEVARHKLDEISAKGKSRLPL